VIAATRPVTGFNVVAVEVGDEGVDENEEGEGEGEGKDEGEDDGKGKVECEDDDVGEDDGDGDGDVDGETTCCWLDGGVGVGVAACMRERG